MWPEIGDPTGLQPGMYDTAGRARIDARTAGTDEHRRTSPRPSKYASTFHTPRIDRVDRRQA
jgi:hypothetical protein